MPRNRSTGDVPTVPDELHPLYPIHPFISEAGDGVIPQGKVRPEMTDGNEEAKSFSPSQKAKAFLELAAEPYDAQDWESFENLYDGYECARERLSQCADYCARQDEALFEAAEIMRDAIKQNDELKKTNKALMKVVVEWGSEK